MLSGAALVVQVWGVLVSLTVTTDSGRAMHFGLTAVGLLGFITLVAWLGRPQLPGG